MVSERITPCLDINMSMERIYVRDNGKAGTKRNFPIIAVALFLAVCLMTLCASVAIRAQEEEEELSLLPGNIVRRISNMMREQLPPEFASESVRTLAAESGGRVSISIKTEPGHSEDDNKAPVISVGAQVSADGGRTWRSGGLDNKNAAAGGITVWEGAIDIGAGSEAIASFRAVDEKQRVAVTLPCSVKKWPPVEEMWDASCVQFQDSRLDACLGRINPAGCMVQMAQDQPPVDDMPYTAGDDLDLIASYIGGDSEYIYLSMAVQRSVSPGSLTPIMLHQYAFVMMSPNRIAPASEDRIPHDGILVRYMPQGETAPDFVQPCAIVTMGEEDEYVLDTESVECVCEGPFVFFKLDRAALGVEKIRELLVMSHTGTVRGIKKEDFSYVDFSLPTRVEFEQGF